MDLEKLANALGPVPVVFGGISDGSQIFNRTDTKKIKKLVDRYQRTFPQSRLHVVSRIFDQKVELPVIIFWVFNRAGLSQESAKQGNNRDIVILIEPNRRQAAMMVGYGLEPFLPQQALDRIIEQAQPYFSSEDYCEGLTIAVERLTELLKSVSQDLPAAVGLQTALATEPGAHDF